MGDMPQSGERWLESGVCRLVSVVVNLLLAFLPWAFDHHGLMKNGAIVDSYLMPLIPVLSSGIVRAERQTQP